MFFKKAFLLLSVTVGLLFSCTTPPNEADRVKTLPESSGKVAEIVIVIDSTKWQSEVGDALKDVLIRYYPGLPQPEAQFSLVSIPNPEFSSLLKSGRNILLVEVTDEKTEGFYKKKNVWAKNQYTASIQAPTPAGLIALIKKHKEELVSYYHEGEIDRLKNKAKQIAIGVPQTLTKENISIAIPKKYKLNIQEGDFHYYINNEPKYMQGILIHSMSSEEFIQHNSNAKDAIISVQDSVTSRFVEGATKGSYMLTERLFFPKYKDLELGNHKAIETRGLWRMENEIMGGPFISYTIFDTLNDRVVTVEAFVFAPSTKKRNFILELEAILQTIEVN